VSDVANPVILMNIATIMTIIPVLFTIVLLDTVLVFQYRFSWS